MFATGTDNGKINIWTLPIADVPNTNEPTSDSGVPPASDAKVSEAEPSSAKLSFNDHQSQEL